MEIHSNIYKSLLRNSLKAYMNSIVTRKTYANTSSFLELQPHIYE